MIVAHEFGWAAVSTEPMTWEEFRLARQLLTEARVGRRVRAAQAAEDDEFAAARRHLTR